MNKLQEILGIIAVSVGIGALFIAWTLIALRWANVI